jgi:sphinganine-1-phosphate aldolase
MRKELPTEGKDWRSLEVELKALGADDARWRDVRTAVFVFHAGDDVLDVAKSAYAMYQSENGLGAGSAFPSLARMEDEVVSIGLSLLNAPDGACGNMTSGGSESIFLTLKTCRDEARAKGVDTRGADIVMPRSAHPAFDKAAGYLDLNIVRVPVGGDRRADVAAMEDALSDRTLMLVGSAPCFPYGVVDPIEEIGELAGANDIWMHVDACVGGYFAPFARMNGVPLPVFDFLVPAVRSMSADLHKYGYAAKGASTVFHRTEAQRQHQIFTCDQWPVGTMTTPSAAGTRAGGAIASAWAVMHYLGEQGYREKTAQVIGCREKLERAIAESDDLFVLGQPQLGLIAYASDTLDIYAVSEQLAAKGWFSPLLDEPHAIHLMLSPEHARVIDDYVADLKQAVKTVAESGLTAKTASARYN